MSDRYQKCPLKFFSLCHYFFKSSNLIVRFLTLLLFLIWIGNLVIEANLVSSIQRVSGELGSSVWFIIFMTSEDAELYPLLPIMQNFWTNFHFVQQDHTKSTLTEFSNIMHPLLIKDIEPMVDWLVRNFISRKANVLKIYKTLYKILYLELGSCVETC